MSRSRIINLANLDQFTAINVLSDPGAGGGRVFVPNCAQIVIRYSLEGGKTGHNVLYGRYAGTFAGTVAQANAILTGLTTGAQWTSLATFLSTTASINQVSIRDVGIPEPAPGGLPILSTGSGAAGTSVSAALPNEVALAVSMSTAAAGPGGRGRLYVAGYATNALGAGNVAAAGVVTATQNWAQTILSVFAGQGYTWVLGRRARVAYIGSTGTSHPARPADSLLLAGVVVKDNHWDSQRRRGLK